MKWLRRLPGMESESFESDDVPRTGRDPLPLLLSQFGEQVRLTGMTRHEDSPWKGLAETAGTIKDDYDTLEKLRVGLTRPVHYPA